jgi:uncharacterized membrane protein (DUF2068 family)
MSFDQKAPAEIRAAGKVVPPLKKRALTLYAIIAFKLAKGLLCLGLAWVLWHEAKHDLSADWDSFLHSPVVSKIFGNLRIHPESQFWIDLATKIDQVTESNMHKAALGAVALSLFPLIEGIGLLFRVSWAGWLAIGESAFFIPIEFYEMVRPHAKPHSFSWSIFTVTVANIIIVWYLYKYRQVLFHHHQRNQPPPACGS